MEPCPTINVNALSETPEALEELYHDAVKAGNKKAFQQAIDDNFKNAPGNLLLASWFYRLHYAAREAKQFIIEWRWVIPLAVSTAYCSGGLLMKNGT